MLARPLTASLLAVSALALCAAPAHAGTPASEEQTMQGIRWVPLVDRVGDRRLTTVSGDWIALASSPETALEKGTYLGSLAGDKGGVAAVYATGAVKDLPSGRPGIGITAKGFDGPGTYKGKLDLEPTADGGELTLTVVMKDSIVWAVLALIAGIEIALRARRWRGNDRVLLAVAQSGAQAGQDFDAAAGALANTPWSGFAAREDFARLVRTLRERLDQEGAKGHLELPQATLDELRAALAKLTAAITDLQTLPRVAEELDRALTAVEALVPRTDVLGAEPREHPVWLSQARGLLTPPAEPTVEGLHARIEEIQKAAAYADRFVATAEEVALDAGDLNRLKGMATEPDDVQKVKRASEAVASAWSNLWNARTVAEASVAAGLEAVTSASRGVRQIAIRPERRRGVQPASAVDQTRAPAGQGLLSALAGLAGAPPEDAARLAHFAGALRRGDAWMRVFAYVIAIGTGLSALYIGKPFGTPLDYVQALLWGGATAAALDALAQVIGLKSSPEAILRPAPPA